MNEPADINAALRYFSLRHQKSPECSHLAMSYEKRMHPHPYEWEDMTRRDSSAPHLLVFQYTLSGYGYFSKNGPLTRLDPGRFFILLLPERYRYWRPPECEAWEFLWMNTTHPFICERVGRLIAKFGSVFSAPNDSLLLMLLHGLYERIAPSILHDAYTIEADLLRWMLELERLVDQTLTPQDQQRQLTENVRELLYRELHRNISVAELAERFSMSRSHFSRHFKAITGSSPAEYQLKIRLEAAVERLRAGRLTLKEIAAETGFNDANHLRKCFQRRFHISPSLYRQQEG